MSDPLVLTEIGVSAFIPKRMLSDSAKESMMRAMAAGLEQAHVAPTTIRYSESETHGLTVADGEFVEGLSLWATGAIPVTDAPAKAYIDEGLPQQFGDGWCRYDWLQSIGRVEPPTWQEVATNHMETE